MNLLLGHTKHQIVTLLVLLLWLAPVFALDKITTNSIRNSPDKRQHYPGQLLYHALERTIPTHGPYVLEPHPLQDKLTRDRAKREILQGRLDVFEAPTREEWELELLPIYIPLRKGILGYKLFLIDGKNQSEFDKVTDIAQLRSMSLGSGAQWSTTKALQAQNFNIVTSIHYRPLFQMLMMSRFDYFPRGVNEIFHELKDWEKTYPDLKVEQGLALYMPLPSYFFVSPDNRPLANRIEYGLNLLIKDGTFDEIFLKKHGKSLKAAKLADRKVFHLDNFTLTEKKPFHRKELWYTP